MHSFSLGNKKKEVLKKFYMFFTCFPNENLWANVKMLPTYKSNCTNTYAHILLCGNKGKITLLISLKQIFIVFAEKYFRKKKVKESGVKKSVKYIKTKLNEQMNDTIKLRLSKLKKNEWNKKRRLVKKSTKFYQRKCKNSLKKQQEVKREHHKKKASAMHSFFHRI